MRDLADPSQVRVIFECWCSHQVQKDDRIIQSVKEKMGASFFDDRAHCDSDKEATLRALEDIAAKNATTLDAIPLKHRLDNAVVQAAVKFGILCDKESVLAYFNGLKAVDFEGDDHEFRENIDETYILLCMTFPQLQLCNNESVARALILQLKCSFSMASDLLLTYPELAKSKEIMNAIWCLSHVCLNEDIPDKPDDFMANCPPKFFDKKDFMVNAISWNGHNITCASDRLLADREYMSEAMKFYYAAITHASEDFQLDNLDIVEEYIENIGKRKDYEYFFNGLSPKVWTHRSVVMKYATHHPCLGILRDIHPKSPFLKDKELISLAVKDSPSEFWFASEELKCDTAFVLQLVKENDEILAYAAKQLRFNEDIVLAALAKNAGTIVYCFNILKSRRDLEFLLGLSLKIRLKLYLHDIFLLQFLRGIMTLEHQDVRPPSLRCYLPMLDQGDETSIDFKGLIAGFLGAPVGEDFVLYEKASLALELFGMY